MKNLSYQIGHLVSSDYDLNKFSSETQYINESNEIISITKIENDIVFFNKPCGKYPFFYVVKRTKEEFQKEFKIIFVEKVFENISFEDIFHLVQEKDDRQKFIKELSSYVDSEDVSTICYEMIDDKKEHNQLVENLVEHLETYSEYRVVKIDSLEKEYAFEKFLEHCNKRV